MKEERYFYVPDAKESNQLPPDEAVHAARVLRLTEGDDIFLMDGKGTFYQASITFVNQKRCEYVINNALPQEPQWKRKIHLAMAPTKMMERVEWMAEKATEIGVDSFSFLQCQFSERKNLRQDRVDKIVVGATKQSRKAWKPAVGELTPFAQFIKEERPGAKFICHCYDEIPRQNLTDVLKEQALQGSTDDITILVGPEGDFSVKEVEMAMEHGYVPVSLGTSRLRTETACLSAIMIAQLFQ